MLPKEKNKIKPQKTAIIKSKYEDKNKSSNIKDNNQKKKYNNNLLKKCQMKYNSFIQEHRDVTMSGTKRYEDKSGEYYLQNLDKYQKNNHLNQRSITSLNINSNNKNYIKYCHTSHNYNSNKHIIKVKKKKLFNELVPIPIKHKNKLKNDVEKKNLHNAIDNAKYIRRYQYSNNIIQQYKENLKIEQIFFNKVKFIQIWWKTIFQIIKIQKYLRGYLYRTKLISVLDKREKYIDKVLNINKCLKKIFLNQFINCLTSYESNKKYYFYKWNDINNRKKIIKKLLDNYSSYKIFREYNYIHNESTTRSIGDINNEKDEIVLDKEFFSVNRKVKKNKSLMDMYTNTKIIKKRKKEKYLSSSSCIFISRKKNLNIGIELSSSQILNRPKNNKIGDLYRTNYNKKGSVNKINNRINIFDHLKIFHKRNKSNNNHQKFNKNNQSDNSNLITITTSKYSIREKYPKEKSYSDLKSVKTNYKKRNHNSNFNIFFKNTKRNHELTNSLNINNYNKNLSTKKRNNEIKTNMNKRKKNNITNRTGNVYRNKQKKRKKIKVYENKLDEYNKKLNAEKNNQNENKDNNKNDNIVKENILPYTESIFDESQFSALLDNSTLNNNNKNTINLTNSEHEKVLTHRNTVNYTTSEMEKINYKKARSNSCVHTPFVLDQDIIIKSDNKLNDIDIKQYFKRWTKKVLIKLLLKKKDMIKNIISAGNIIKNFTLAKLYERFMNNFKLLYINLTLRKIQDFFDSYKIKILIKEMKLIRQKSNLLKYFNFYKDIICKKIIIQNIIKNKRNKEKKHNEIKKRNKQTILSDIKLGNAHFITDAPYINYNTNYINNKINLNNTNNCYIINNNYNNNTNKINIGMTFQTDSICNTIQNDQNNNTINCLGKIQSKIIEIPKNIYKQKKVKQSMALYNLNNKIILNDDIIDNNIIDNFNTGSNFNTTSNKKAEKNCSHKKNLSKSVILPNKISYFEPDLITQKNQLMMVINIVERHRKSQKANVILSYFKIWKNLLEYNLPKIIDSNSSFNPNNNIRNKKNIIKNNISLKNEKNVSSGTSDYEDITKNTFGTDDFHIESDSKSENKISTKSRIISNIKLNSKINPEINKGIYIKKTIGQNKNISFVKKTSFNSTNNNNELLNLNQNIFQMNNCRLSSKTIPHHSNNSFQSTIFQNNNENIYINKPLSNKNINEIFKKNEMNDFNNKYIAPEDYFGFKKANKIQEMEISFLPLKENKKTTDYDNNNNTNNNYFNSSNNNNNNNNRKDAVEHNEIEQKEVIVEANEEENDYDGDNNENNIIQKIKKEFNDDNKFENYYMTQYNFKRTIHIENIDISELNMENKSMLDGFFA